MRHIQPAAEVAVEREPCLVDSVAGHHPRVADIHVVLPPTELLTCPWQIAGACGHRIRAGGQEIVGRETVRRVQLVVDLHQELVGVIRAGHIALPDVVGHVGGREVRADDFHRYWIKAVGADDAVDAVAAKRQPGGRIDWEGSRGAEVADSFLRGRNDGRVEE